MSNSIDNRVVKMGFDNKQFESGVRTSIDTLEKLKKSLNLDGAGKGLANLEKASKNFSLSGIADGVDHISSKFTALGIIGITTLQNITNSAINAGKRMVSALTIDPVKAGLQEYETKMNAITTILTNTKSKGTTLDDVNKALAELNEYADKTIYNFAEMTRNIGTFTAAGIDLDTSVKSIKGIANLAAGSGSSAMQASTAMYQLSQALAAGSLKLQDWNSVVNAGMGGELFQNALKETAKQMGIVVDESIPFRNSLESGWITAEVLTKTLERFADDDTLVKAATQVKTFTQLWDTMKESVQSGWAVSWEYIIGDREQAIEVLTSISDAFNNLIGPSADARNEMLKFWNENGGRDAVIEGITNALKTLQSVLKPIGEAFREIFPPMTGEKLVEMSKGFRDLMSNFKIGETTASNLKSTFKGLFALLDIGKQAIFAAGKAIGSLVGFIAPASDGFLGITATIGEFLVSMNEAIKSSDAFGTGFQLVVDFLKNIANGFKGIVKGIQESFGSLGDMDMKGLDTFAERVKTRFEPVTKLGEFMGKVLSKIGDGLKGVAPVFYKLADVIGGAFKKLSDNIINAFDNAEFSSLFDIVNGSLFAGILLGLRKFIDSITGITDEAGGFLGGITGILDGVKGSLEAYQTQLKAGVLMKIAIAIGILSASLLTLSLIDSDKLTSSLSALTIMLIELIAALTIFTKIMGGGAGAMAMAKLTVMTGVLIGMSSAILILSFAMKTLSDLDWAGIAKGLVSVGALAAILVTTAKILSANKGTMIKGAVGFIAFAIALNVLAQAVERLAKIDTGGLIKGLVGIGVLVTELALFLKFTDLDKMSIGKGVGLIALAIALNILAKAVEKFSEIDAGAMVKGLIGLGVVLAEIAVFVNMTGDAKKVIATATGLIVLGAAMFIFASAIEKMGNLSIEQIAKGLITMGIALGVITLAFRMLPKNIFLQSLALIDMAGAMMLLAGAIEKMGSLSWGELAKGLLGLVGALGIMVVALEMMKNEFVDAAAMTMVIASLYILAKAMKLLGSMSIGEIALALLAMAGAFAVLGAAALLLSPLIPAILALAGAIAIFGVACLAVGAGVLAFSAGLAALAVSGTAGAAALVAIISSIIGLIPFLFETIAQGIVDFARIIGEGAPVITEAIVAIGLGMVAAVATIVPKVVEAFLQVVTDVLTALANSVPKMVDAGMKIVIGFLQGIANNIQKVVEVGIDIVVNFIKGVAEKIPDVIQAAFDLAIAFINGLAEALRGNMEPLMAAMENLVSAIIECGLKLLLGSLPFFQESGGKIMDSGLIQGIKSKIQNFVKSLDDMAMTGVKTLVGKVKDFVGVGNQVVAGFIKGIRDKIGDVANQAANMASAALNAAKKKLGIKSPSKEFKEIGKYSSEGFATGIRSYSWMAKDAANKLSNETLGSLKSSISKVNDFINDNMDLNPTIKPVLDLSEANKRLGDLYSNKQVSLAGTTAKKTAAIKATLPRQLDDVWFKPVSSVPVKDESKIEVNNHYTVRGDKDIRKINKDLRNTLDRFRSAKGVPVKP